MFARVIQRMPNVHSVRWRIKDTHHLIEKIIRKCSENKEKYKDINSDNYFEVVTDLVGLRALHLFKDDCFEIDKTLRATWTNTEPPIAYVRQGDPIDLTNRFDERGFKVEPHPAGYRSIHYIFSTQPAKRKVLAEVQVRTIFEEGWSEIDHRVRYPNFSNDKQVSYFLTIFNRLAGSADEMGTFVQGLTSALDDFQLQLSDANKQKEEALTSMDKLLSDLEAAKRQDADTKGKLASLQQEMTKLRSIPSVTDMNASSATQRMAAIGGMSHASLADFFGNTDAIARYADQLEKTKRITSLVLGESEQLEKIRSLTERSGALLNGTRKGK